MGNLLAYSGTTTKIRAIRSRLLTLKEFRELTETRSVTEALTYLKQKPGFSQIFADVDESKLHRGQIERMLTNAIYVDFQKIYMFAPVHQRKFLDLYFKRYEISIIKTCMRMVFDHRDVTLDLTIFQDFFSKHSNLNLTAISSVDTVSEFTKILKDTIYYPALQRLSTRPNASLWDYEMTLDLVYFTWFWKQKDVVLTKDEQRVFSKAYGVKMDLLNLRWIFRTRHYFHMEPAAVYSLLIPVNYHLTKEQIIQLTEASTREEFHTALLKTYYARRYKNFTEDNLDSMYNVIRYHIQRKEARQDPYSLATMISFLYEKEHQINRIIITLECIRYGIPPQEILEYIQQTT